MCDSKGLTLAGHAVLNEASGAAILFRAFGAFLVFPGGRLASFRGRSLNADKVAG
jgi:hypothetical protein